LYTKSVVFFDPVKDKFLLVQLSGDVELMASPLMMIRVWCWSFFVEDKRRVRRLEARPLKVDVRREEYVAKHF
jgi:hypothetical protein